MVPGGDTMIRITVLSLVVLSAFFAAVQHAQAPAYRITHTYNVGGDGRWDYVVPDPPNHRIFIGRTSRVMVVDEDNGKLLGEVTGIDGAHGTALAERWGHGFATSGNDGTVVMFDLKTFKSLGKTPAAPDADAIVYDPASDRVFTLNGDAHSSTVIDPYERVSVIACSSHYAAVNSSNTKKKRRCQTREALWSNLSACTSDPPW